MVYYIYVQIHLLSIYMLPNVEILNAYGHEKQLKCWHRCNVSNVSRVVSHAESSSSFPIDAATKEIGTKSVKLWRRYFYLPTTININTVTAFGLEVSLSFDTNWNRNIPQNFQERNYLTLIWKCTY